MALVLLAGLLTGCTSPETAELVIDGVTLIDGTGSAPKIVTVVIGNGKIQEILSPDRGHRVRAERRIDGEGRHLIPGLWDVHVHLAALTGPHPDALDILLRHGITTIRDMGGDADTVLPWREEIAVGKRSGPHLFAVGAHINSAQDITFHRYAADAGAARELVGGLAAREVDLIKIHNQLKPEAFYAVLEEAKSHALKVTGHIPKGISAMEACRSGMAEVAHIVALVEAPLYREERPAAGIPEALEEAGRSELHRCLVEHGVVLTPNLVMYLGFIDSIEDPTRRQMTQRLLDELVQLTGALHEAGVMLMTGSDSPGLQKEIPFGSSLHQELELLVQAGLTPHEAIMAASSSPARFMGVADEWGTLEIGKQADALLLAADPLEDISNTQRIELVLIGGVVAGP
jgi:imidazolonepropionase-like amidohydrolase